MAMGEVAMSRPTVEVNALPDAFGATERPADTVAEDLGLAERAVRVHCSIAWPEGARCINCHRPHPCPVYSWGHAKLLACGRTEAEVAGLDRRMGAWS
jgi:hypothetical protein